MKGQASIELLVTLGIVLAFTIPMLFLLLTVTSVGYENTSLAQAEASARSLSDSVNLVYGQGIGAKRVVLLNLPSNTNSIEIGENEVTITLTTSSGVFEASAPVFANVRSTTITRDSGPMAGLIALQLEAA
ncbi:MAG TPA: hypothetical protein EYP90_13170, partial [Chromatiaceae bacterium]|nr:hypothetical protein [Chromatiaceae bacterium]